MAGTGSQPVDVEVLDSSGWHGVRLQITASRVSDALNEGAPLDLDEVLLVVPPPVPAGDPSRRLHRPPHPLWVRIGEWSVTGSLHLPPGTVGSAYLLRRNHQFFVLTDALLARPLPGGREERRVPVLLVNLGLVSSLRDTPEPEAPPAIVGLPPA